MYKFTYKLKCLIGTKEDVFKADEKHNFKKSKLPSRDFERISYKIHNVIVLYTMYHDLKVLHICFVFSMNRIRVTVRI